MRVWGIRSLLVTEDIRKALFFPGVVACLWDLLRYDWRSASKEPRWLQMAAGQCEAADDHRCVCTRAAGQRGAPWMLRSHALCTLHTINTFCCQNNLKLRYLPPLPFPSSPPLLCPPPRILPFCPEVFVQCHGGRDQTVVHLREAGEAQTSTSSYVEDRCSDQHAHLQRPTTPGKGQHELQHWDDSRVSMTICSPQAKSLLSNISGVVPETRDNGIDGITRFTINHSDMGTLTKHGQLKMAASATQVWQHSSLCSRSQRHKKRSLAEVNWGKHDTQIISFKSDVYVRKMTSKYQFGQWFRILFKNSRGSKQRSGNKDNNW